MILSISNKAINGGQALAQQKVAPFVTKRLRVWVEETASLQIKVKTAYDTDPTLREPCPF